MNIAAHSSPRPAPERQRMRALDSSLACEGASRVLGRPILTRATDAAPVRRMASAPAFDARGCPVSSLPHVMKPNARSR